MKTAPITPAELRFDDAGAPARPASCGDVDHPPVAAPAQAQHVFLQGNQLPARWAGRAHFTVLEMGFGLGDNFLATWLAWRNDPQRCQRLHMVSLELHPLTRDDLQRAHAAAPAALRPLADVLLAAWPPLTPGLHALDFEAGQVRLLLAFGDAAQLLPALRLQADAFYLDGFAPARHAQPWQPWQPREPRVLQALARKAAPGATLASGCATAALRHGLRSAGFVVQPTASTGGKWEMTLARYAPAFVPKRPASLACMADTRSCSEAVVIGAGIAGAAVAQALARLGVAVTVFDQHPAPAQETSGNPAGLFHGTVHAGDSTHARLYRAAALQAWRDHAAALADGVVPGSARGLLRLATAGDSLDAMRALLQRQGLPPDYVQALDAGAASRLAGVRLQQPAWFYPGGGWIDPPAWVQAALAAPGVQFSGGRHIARLQHDGTRWLLLDMQGQPVASSSTVVLANAAAAQTLLAPLGHAPWPLHHTRGQVTFWPGSAQRMQPQPQSQPRLLMPVAGDGYAVPLTAGGLLCGATREAGNPDGDTAPRNHDHRLNIDRLQRLTGLRAPDDSALWQGRSGWRLDADDKLPIAGPLALPPATMPPQQRLDQARLLPRVEGLFVLSALGARGLTLAPLLGRLVAAQATGTPWPLEQDLADAVDPARWLVRAARHAGRTVAPAAPAPAAPAATGTAGLQLPD